MKKIISVILTVIIAMAFAGCTNNAANNASKTESDSGVTGGEKSVVRLGALKGPTSMGLVKLLDEDEKEQTENDYEFTMSAAADELTPALLKGELDILALPVNLGSVLYNKSNGAVKMLAVNMLGAIYIAKKDGSTVNGFSDLKGKTIYATGKGSTPEYVLSYLLSQNGMDIEKDVTVEWKSEPTEVVAAMGAGKCKIAMLPQPFVAVAETQIENLRVALDLYSEWEKLGGDSSFITAGIIVNSKFAEQNPEAVKKFLEEYARSTDFVKQNIDEASALIEKYDIVKAQIAKKALPQCNIVCMTGDEMKRSVLGYYKVLYDYAPDSVGGAIPGDDYFLMYE